MNASVEFAPYEDFEDILKLIELDGDTSLSDFKDDLTIKKKVIKMFNKLKVPNYLLTLQSPVLAENTETICGVCHNLAFLELIDAQYELSDVGVLEIARKRFRF